MNETKDIGQAALKTERKRWLRPASKTAPAFGVAALTPFACPACWPALIGFLSSIGIGAAAITPYLLPLTALFLTLALVPLWSGARNRRDYGTLALGAVAGVAVIVGMFIFIYEPLLYGGAALLIFASMRNMQLGKKERDEACPACVTTSQPG